MERSQPARRRLEAAVGEPPPAKEPQQRPRYRETRYGDQPESQQAAMVRPDWRVRGHWHWLRGGLLELLRRSGQCGPRHASGGAHAGPCRHQSRPDDGAPAARIPHRGRDAAASARAAARRAPGAAGCGRSAESRQRHGDAVEPEDHRVQAAGHGRRRRSSPSGRMDCSSKGRITTSGCSSSASASFPASSTLRI